MCTIIDVIPFCDSNCTFPDFILSLNFTNYLLPNIYDFNDTNANDKSINFEFDMNNLRRNLWRMQSSFSKTWFHWWWALLWRATLKWWFLLLTHVLLLCLLCKLLIPFLLQHWWYRWWSVWLLWNISTRLTHSWLYIS